MFVAAVCAVGAVWVAACAQAPGGVRNGVPVLATPRLGAFPTPIGGRGLGRVEHARAAVTIADSVLRRWGWRVALADSAVAGLRTAWLYLPRGSFDPGHGSQCDAGAFTALRVSIAARDSAHGPAVLFLRGEAMFYDTATSAEAARLVRTTFSRVGAELAAAVRGADAREDVYGESLRRRRGNAAVKTLDDLPGCR